MTGLSVGGVRLGGAQPLGFVEGEFGEEFPFAVGEGGDAVVEAGDGHARAVVVEGCDEAGGGGGGVGYGAAEGSGVDVLVGAVEFDLAVGEAAHSGADGGGVLGPHAGVGDDHGVCGEAVPVLLDEGAEVGGAGFLFALHEELEVDGGSGAAGGGEVGADAECVEEHLSLVVGCSARVEAVSDDDGFEGVGVPAVLAGRGLDVVVPVDEDGGGVRVVGGPVGEDGGGAGCLPDLGGREAGLPEFRGEPVGAAAYVGCVVGLGRHGRDSEPLGEVLEERVVVGLDVRTDGADGVVNGLAHGPEPIRPPGRARAVVPVLCGRRGRGWGLRGGGVPVPRVRGGRGG